jgi:hypothetical protein
MVTSIRPPPGTAITSMTAILAATLAGALAVLLPGVPEVKAEPQATAAFAQVQSKTDRLPILAKGAACSSFGWPNYEPACQFDKSRPADEMPTVRIIKLR